MSTGLAVINFKSSIPNVITDHWLQRLLGIGAENLRRLIRSLPSPRCQYDNSVTDDILTPAYVAACKDLLDQGAQLFSKFCLRVLGNR
jgi:hypothetical protein